MNTLSPRRSAAAFTGLLGLALVSFAQTPVPPPPEPIAASTLSDQPIVLNTFTVDVSRDRGYIAVDSLAGGRTNTAIKFTPSAMSSLTRAFIDDLAITNVRDALQWTLNVVPSDWQAGKASSNPFNAWDFNFRGAGQSLQGGAGPMRNYFTFYQVADSYNIERIEADRGPNSILFGVGTVGGVLSVYTKVPRLDNAFTHGTGSVDSNGGYRFELDTNQPLTDRVALRLNTVYDERRGWRDGDRNRFEAIDLAVLFKFTDATSLRVEAEGARSDNTLISSTFAEAISSWDGTTVADTWGQTIANPGVTTMRQWGPTNYNVWVAGQPEIGLQDWAAGSRSVGIFLPIAPHGDWYPTSMTNGSTTLAGARMPVTPDREFTFGSGRSTPKYTTLTAFLDHTFNENFEAQLSFYDYSDSHRALNYEGLSYYSVDLNRQLPNGSPNPNFGQRFGDYFLSNQLQDRTVREYRAQLNYKFDAAPFGISLKQRFSLAAGSQEITWHARQRMAQDLSNPSSRWEDKMIWARLYENNPNASPNLPTEINGRPIVYAPLPFDWFDFDESYDLDSVSFMSQSLLWEDRISVLLGARSDRYKHHKLGANTGSVVNDRADGTTYSAGAIYYFIPKLGAFVNYSENFDPIGPGKNPGLDGESFGPARGEGMEYGLRFSSDDGKYYATLNRYDTKSSGRITGSRIDLAGLWRQYYLVRGETGDPARTQLSYDDTEALDVSGYEFEITANPTENLRLQAGFAKPDSKIVESMPGQRAYYAEFLPTWQTAAAGTSPEAETLRTQLTNAQSRLDENVAGATKTGLVDYTANVFANYTFLGNALDGFSIGAGAARTGAQYLNTIDDVKRYSSVRTTVNAVLAYDTTFRDIGVRIALNIENLLNERDPIVTSYDGAWKDPAGNPIRNGYYFQTPRTFRLTARLSF